MSKGVFTIIDSYIGKQEKILCVADLLNKRMNEIRKGGRRPTAADIEKTHNIFLRAIFKPQAIFAFEYFKIVSESGNNISLSNNINSSNKVKFNFKANSGNFLHDMVIRVVIESTAESLNTAPVGTQRFKYCDYPGIRLFKNVALTIDETPVDDYTSEDMLFYMRHKLMTHKRPGWNRMVGQEEPRIGSTYVGGTAGEYAIQERFLTGTQTYKALQPRLELWIPLIFWFNLDVTQSFRNTLIPTEQKYITVDLATVNEMIRTGDRGGADVAQAIQRLRILTMDLYTRNIYVSPEVNDVFMLHKDIILMRLHRRHIQTLTDPFGEILLSQLKYPIEYMHFGFRPDSNLLDFFAWNKFSIVTNEQFPRPVVVPGALPGTFVVVVRQANVPNLQAVVDTVGFKLSGNVIYPLTPVTLFKDHIPLSMPVTIANLISNNDDFGTYFLSFCHFPGMFDPSGHFNNSTGREFYLQYESSANRIGQGTSAVKLYTSAKCLNFMYIDGFTMRIKYIT
jgi:hypothetical protein